MLKKLTIYTHGYICFPLALEITDKRYHFIAMKFQT